MSSLSFRLRTQECCCALLSCWMAWPSASPVAVLPQWWPEIMTLLMRRAWFQRRFMGFLSQLRIRYVHSDLTTECAPGSPTAGYRAPDVTLQPGAASLDTLDPKPARLFQLLRGTHHTLLAFCEPGDALAHEVSELQARFGALLRAVCVGAGTGAGAAHGAHANGAHANGTATNGAVPSAAAHGGAVLRFKDADGAARARYGVSQPCAFLIRPDGYIGVARAPAGGRLAKEVARRFACE